MLLSWTTQQLQWELLMFQLLGRPNRGKAEGGSSLFLCQSCSGSRHRRFYWGWNSTSCGRGAGRLTSRRHTPYCRVRCQDCGACCLWEKGRCMEVTCKGSQGCHLPLLSDKCCTWFQMMQRHLLFHSCANDPSLLHHRRHRNLHRCFLRCHRNPNSFLLLLLMTDRPL